MSDTFNGRDTLNLFESKNLPPIYQAWKHQNGWWCIRDEIRNTILDGFYFRSMLDAKKQADTLNKNYDETETQEA